jgi:putative chitinase
MNQSGNILVGLLLCGLMGLIGQGIRAVAGLKNAASVDASPNQASVFSAAYLGVSLMIGFIAGVAAGLAMFDKIFGPNATITVELLLGLVAAGYAGADFIETTASKLIPGLGGSQGSSQKNASRDLGGSQSDKSVASASDKIADQRLSDVEDRIAGLETAASPQPSALLSNTSGVISKVTVDMVRKMFPATPAAPIIKNLPFVLAGLQWIELTDKAMICMALATIRAETEGFVPISEGKSIYNTDKTPFDKYEPGTPVGLRLGNTEPGDGPRFKGRGFVQLTGRDNYTKIGGEVHVDLVGSPELANDAAIAGKILGQFLHDGEKLIRDALSKNDLAAARRAVNGGSHGLKQFSDAYEIGMKTIPA